MMKYFIIVVSILVLMEVTLLLFLLQGLVYRKKEVSILVLMEVTLLQNVPDSAPFISICFNPCFNGSYSSTLLPFLED